MSAHLAKPLTAPDQLLLTKQRHQAGVQEHPSAKVAPVLSTRPGVRYDSAATELEPHWVAAIEAATD